MSDDKKAAVTEQETDDSKSRIGGFPTVSLQKALTLMQKVWEKEKRNPAPVAAIMEHWEYAAKSSGGFQAIASLKKFGLLDGAAGTRNLKLTSLALDLLKYETTDTLEYWKLVKQSALLPDLHQEMWKKYGHELPSDKTIESFLVFDKHYPEASSRQFIKLYKETISFAKLADGDKIEEINPKANEIDGGKQTNLPKPAAGGSKVENMETVINSGQLPIPIGGRVALVPFPMSEDDFELFLGTLNLWKKKLIAKVKANPTETFPFVVMWKNKDFDKMVKITGVAGEKNGEKFYQSEDGTGIPASEIFPDA